MDQETPAPFFPQQPQQEPVFWPEILSKCSLCLCLSFPPCGKEVLHQQKMQTGSPNAYVGAARVSCACRDQEGALDPLELELEDNVICQVGSGNLTLVLWKISKAFLTTEPSRQPLQGMLLHIPLLL